MITAFRPSLRYLSVLGALCTLCVKAHPGVLTVYMV